MDIQRISAFVTVVALLYIFVQLVSLYGPAGLIGMGLSLAVVATGFVLWSRRKKARGPAD